jgi:hypothetical protein
MGVDGRTIATMIEQYLPDDFLDRLLRSVFTAHKVSFAHVRAELPLTEARNLLPYYRRAKLEEYLRGAAERSGMHATAVKAPGSGWYHSEVRSGPVVLTASSVQSPCGPVDPSDFRLSLAEENPQYPLWAEPGDVTNEARPIYVLLLHSRSSWASVTDEQKYGGLPGSAYLAYPSAGLETYVHDINLFDKFPEVVDSYMPQEWNSEARIRYVRSARRLSA